MGRKIFYRRSKKGGSPQHTYNKERKHSKPKFTDRGRRDHRTRRPPRILKTDAPHPIPSLLLDSTKHDVVLVKGVDGRMLRRPVPVIDMFSRRVMGFVVAEVAAVEAPVNAPIILADNGPAYRSQVLGDLPGCLSVGSSQSGLFVGQTVRPPSNSILRRSPSDPLTPTPRTTRLTM